MMKGITTVQIDIQVDEDILDGSLEVLEALLDGMAARGLIRCAHIYIESETQVATDSWGPMLTATVQ